MSSNDKTEEQQWLEIRQEAHYWKERESGFNFVEITRMPNKLESKTLVSIVIKATNVIPRGCDMCLKESKFGDAEHAAIVEFKSEAEAVKVVDKLKASIFCKNWRFSVVRDPKSSPFKLA